MKILAINGSPRKNGNTAALLNQVLEGAASQKAETELIHLYDLAYKGCVSCFACKRKDGAHGKCAMKDDLSPVLEKLKTADAIAFGSPIYLMNVTSGMAALLERFYFSNSIYSLEIPTVYPKKAPSCFVYTMNMTQERVNQFGLKQSLRPYETFVETLLGEKPELFYAYNTYQFSDYSKYESSMFSEVDKARYKAEHFPADCDEAFQMGVRLVRRI